MTEAVIVSGVRTAIGNYGGALQDVSAVKLGSIVINGAMKKAGLRPGVSKEALEYRSAGATASCPSPQNRVMLTSR